MIFPIPRAIVYFPNGDPFETTQVEHLYNLHLELEEAYPRLPRGGFRLHVIEENEEEETVRFELAIDPFHLQTNVLLDDLGEVAVFEISFSWWLHGGKEEWEEPCDSWAIYVAVDFDHLQRTETGWIPHSYGEYDAEENAVKKWYDQLAPLLSATSPYSEEIVKQIEKEFHACLNEIVLHE